MKPVPSRHDQGWDEEVIKIMKRLGSLKVEYPAELLAARRAAFIIQVEQLAGDDVPADDLFLRHLENLKTVEVQYPPELRTARRAAFMNQVEQHRQVQNSEELHLEDQKLIGLFTKLKSVDADYPPALLTARRTAFRRQLALEGGVSVLDALWTSLQTLFPYKLRIPAIPVMNMMRTSLVIAVLMLATFVGSLLRVPVQSFNPSPSQAEISKPGHTLAVTGTIEVEKVICKPGYLPPLCLVGEADVNQDLTFQGNGSARPAVAKDTLPGYGGIHRASYVNDGLYGPGASWVSNSAYSWIKIDLGKDTVINTVAFGRDRLGKFNDRDPGRFVIAVALSDNAYEDGNSSNDYVEYTEVYDSEQVGFDGVVSGPETIQAQFEPVMVRFIKITFANPGTAIDEVKAFMVSPPVAADDLTRKPRENLPSTYPTSIPVRTLAPTNTPIPPDTKTPVPADTATPVPTHTPAPTDTPIPAPTDTPIPVPTDTPIPVPTNTRIPAPTDTKVPPPEDTPVPPPADLMNPTDTSDSIPSTSIPFMNMEWGDVPTEVSLSAEP
ncbi:MAG TPA: hypothetical protein VHP14_22595 [Anaerolineales bacterium]|nr:hypothetical protein [Anaerolineales bacterium]